MNLQSLKLGEGLQLMMRTTPILLIRLGATLLFWVVALVYLAIVFGVASLIAQAVEFLGIIIFLIALISVIPLYNLAYRYVFFMIKAAHIAIIAEVLQNGDLPDGVNQLEWGRKRVEERFGEVNGMFVVDELVTGVVRAFTNTVYSVTRWLPGDTMDGLVRLLNRVIQYAMSYIDEAILARSFWQTEQNVWANARDGLALYAQAWKPLLMNAIALMILSFVPSVVGFVLLAAPVGFILAVISPALAGWTLIFLLLLAFFIKIGIGDAFAITVMIAAYQRETANLQPNAEITGQLENVSDKFRELMDRARQAPGTSSKPKNETPTNTTPGDDVVPPVNDVPPTTGNPAPYSDPSQPRPGV